jgi:hypothetical protein
MGGKVTFDLLDSSGKVLATGSSGENTISGKKGGHARIWESNWVTAAVPPGVAPKASSIRVHAIVLNDNAPLPLGLGSWHIDFITVNM